MPRKRTFTNSKLKVYFHKFQGDLPRLAKKFDCSVATVYRHCASVGLDTKQYNGLTKIGKKDSAQIKARKKRALRKTRPEKGSKGLSHRNVGNNFAALPSTTSVRNRSHRRKVLKHAKTPDQFLNLFNIQAGVHEVARMVDIPKSVVISLTRRCCSEVWNNNEHPEFPEPTTPRELMVFSVMEEILRSDDRSEKVRELLLDVGMIRSLCGAQRKRNVRGPNKRVIERYHGKYLEHQITLTQQKLKAETLSRTLPEKKVKKKVNNRKTL